MTAELQGVRLTKDEDGYSLYILDGSPLRGEWVPWAEAATLEVIGNSLRGYSTVRKERNLINKLLALLEG